MRLEFDENIVELESRIRDLENRQMNGEKGTEQKIQTLQVQYTKLKNKVYANMTPWQRVQIARHPKRPYLGDYIPRIFNDFMELHGDRGFGDDGAIMGGMALFDKTPVMVIGHRKGRSLKESMERNFGMPHPEGYRKALRLMRLAERYDMPILTFIDTAGAYPGIGAEERGQAEAIAKNLREMSVLKVPIVVTVLGEGGSGGALAIGIGDVICMLENAWYSVISPEGCAAILFHDASKAEMAAKALKLTAEDLQGFGVVDDIIAEPQGGAHKDPDVVATNLKMAISKHLKSLQSLSVTNLLAHRFEKFRNIGTWQERKPTPPGRKKRKPKK